MASAGLKRPSPSDVPPHSSSQLSPNSYWAVNKRRCTTQMAQQQRLFRDPAAILGSLSDDVTSMIRNEVIKQQQHQHQNHHHQPHHVHHHNHHQHPHQHNQQQQQLHQHNQSNHNQPNHHQHHADTLVSQSQQNQSSNNLSNVASCSVDLDKPVLSIRQTQAICEKLINAQKEREHKLREEYDKILISKLSEQYDTFVKYTHDHIERRYNEHNSHQASYLS